MKLLFLFLMGIVQWDKTTLKLHDTQFPCFKEGGFNCALSEHNDFFVLADQYCEKHVKRFGMFNGIWDKKHIFKTPDLTIDCMNVWETVVDDLTPRYVRDRIVYLGEE